MLIALAACAANFLVQGSALADDAQENKALKEQMRQMMQRMDALQKQVEALQKQQAAPPPVVTAPPAPPPAAPPAPPAGPAVAKQAPPEPAFEKFAKGFYGTLDVSADYVTKGMSDLGAFHYSAYDPTNPVYTITGTKVGPVGRVGWQADLSTNKSVLGYRGSHTIPGGAFDFIYQIEVQPSITSAPGASTGYTAQSNVTKAGIGYGNSFVGISNNEWGKFKAGTTYTPYKQSTDRMNPFSGMLGDYAVVMGNTGGDNRVEFGTRLDHSIWYESPKFGGVVSFDALFSPGQNRTPYNEGQSAGSPDCAGGNVPGSGNLPLACADGAFNNAFSFDLKFEDGPIYVTAAYELHQGVNRSSDGIGSNSPYYASLWTLDPTGACVPTSPLGALLIDCADYNTYAAEFPQAAPAGSPGLYQDVANEYAYKIGAQYTFSFGLAVSGIYEEMHRTVPADMEWQNERQRMGFWFAATQDITPKDNFSVGWAHAGSSTGDPGGQHNYNPNSTQNYANMYTAALKHRFDKNLYWYFNIAETINHDNAHYDLGAGGRGVTIDCHDGTTQAFIDYSSAGPTTWGGCRPLGVSTGLHYTF